MTQKSLIAALLSIALNAHSSAEVSVAISTIQQGNEVGESPTIFQLARSGDTTSPLSINLLLRGTALPDLDYIPPTESTGPHSITIASGESTTSGIIPTLSDDICDPGESLLAIVQKGPGYIITPGMGRTTAPTLSRNGTSGWNAFVAAPPWVAGAAWNAATNLPARAVSTPATT